MGKVALGQAAPSGGGVAAVLSNTEMTTEDRILLIEQQIAVLSRAIALIRRRNKRVVEKEPAIQQANVSLNKDGIPIGLVCYGVTEKSQFPFCATVEADGYLIGAMKMQSLSAAAEAVSGVRRSGWTFWRLPDGRTLKEVFKDV